MSIKVFIYEVQEFFSYIRRDVFAKRWVEPNDFPCPVSWGFSDFFFLVFNLIVESALVKNTLIVSCCFIKYPFAGGKVSQPIFDGYRQLLDDVRRMIRLCIDVASLIVRFSVWFERAIVEVECHV